ncbi:MAG: Nramp family divalent metal transporter [Planctomycetes bacterium]|nr:Nramp family divalent metal transporter [Planctomycetota bacterium]
MRDRDPYTLSPDAVREPPHDVWATLRKIGPGLILAGSIVGTGELIQTTDVGAKAGFALLWLVLLSCFIKVFVQVELGRHAISAGETTLTSLRRLPGPGPLLTWWWLLMTACSQCQLGSMVGSVGQTGHMVFPGVSRWLAGALGGPESPLGARFLERPELPWAVATAALTSALLAIGSYKVIERGTIAMVVVFTFVTVACVVLLRAVGHPVDWGEVGAGLLPAVPRDPNVLVAAVAMFGITGVGASELITYPYWCIEKGYARSVGPRPGAGGTGRVDASGERDWERRARGWIRVLRLDAWISMAIYTTATLAFFALGAAVLHGHTGGKGLGANVSAMMSNLAAMYEPVLGSTGALAFIVIGTFAVLYSTLFAATAANCRTVTDFLKVNGFIEIRCHADRLRWLRGFCIGFPFLNLGLFIWIGNPVVMVMIGGVAQALTLPMIAAAAVYLRYRRTDRRLQPGRLWDAFLWLSMLALVAVAASLLWSEYGRWRGPAR